MVVGGEGRDNSDWASLMTDQLFSASFLKIERAKRFIHELEAEIEAYRQSKPLSAHFVHDVTPPEISISWTALPLIISAIIGDAIHNLRTALDLMASELARLNQESDKNVYFPFSDSADTYDDAIKRRSFHKAGADAVALIKSFQPYRGGNESLRSLHELDILDKHSMLVPFNRTMNFRVAGSYQSDDLSNHSFSIDADIIVVFPDDAPLAGLPIVDALKQLVDLVEGILEAFARMVELRGP